MTELDQARAAYLEDAAVAAEAYAAAMEAPDAAMNAAMKMARASKTDVTRAEITAYITAATEAAELCRAIRGPSETALKALLNHGKENE